jgi:hypothetical protein
MNIKAIRVCIRRERDTCASKPAADLTIAPTVQAPCESAANLACMCGLLCDGERDLGGVEVGALEAAHAVAVAHDARVDAGGL